jgi:TPR repeat protein
MRRSVFTGFECLIDRHDISGGEDWKRRLGSLISQADTIVFVLSPSSAQSPICDWEVEEAVRLNKRILPVNCRPLEGISPPLRLRDLNYIFLYEEPKVLGSGFGTGLASLITALNTDFDWLRDHTRYLQRATEWDRGGRPVNRLLSGDDIAEAKAWVARRPKNAPEPTALHLEFIRASEQEAAARLSEQRKQLEAMAAAQAEREMALHKAEEALKQAADAQRRRARIRNIALVVVSILAVLAGWLGWSAEQQRKVAEQQRITAEEQRTLAQRQQRSAEEQRQQADEILVRGMNVISKLQAGMDSETQHEAFELFQTGAIHGDVIAMSNLGIAYQFGYGVPQDYAKAREWFEKAAAKDFAPAMYSIGVFFDNGYGVPQDYVKAREWYEKAAAKDNADSMNNLGMLFGNGYGVSQDYAKAREWYEEAAAKDNAGAMVNLGNLFANGQGVPQDYVKAREWLERAAAKDFAPAMYNLGVFFENGFGVPQEYAKAREWYEKAAAKNDADAMYKIGVFFDNGYGVTQDYGKAHEWYEKAAAKDNAVAMFNLGGLFANGQGVPQDYVKASEWWEKAAANDNAAAMGNLGTLYYNGQGVPQDYDKAREFFDKAAAKDNANAMVGLGVLYAEGHGVPQDYAKAGEWLEKAAAKLEAEETKRDGKPGEQTARALSGVIGSALFAKDFTKALTVAERAHALFPDDTGIESNRAHALMFLGHDEEAKALYLAHKREPVSGEINKLWEQVIAHDFAAFRKAGLTHPMMADIEKELGISR